MDDSKTIEASGVFGIPKWIMKKGMRYVHYIIVLLVVRDSHNSCILLLLADFIGLVQSIVYYIQ